ncbi:class III signal peptide-containing protein [Methanopyrus sp.]
MLARASGQVSVEFALLSIIVLTAVFIAGRYMGPEYEWYCVKKAVSDAIAKTQEQVAVGVALEGWGEISGRLSMKGCQVGDDKVVCLLAYSGDNPAGVVELLRRNILLQVYVALYGRPRSVDEIPNPVKGSWASYRVDVSGRSEIKVVVERIKG